MAYTFARDFEFSYPKRVVKDRGEPTQRAVMIGIRTSVRVEIDLEGLARKLGERAFKNKSHSAILADRMVRVTAEPAKSE